MALFNKLFNKRKLVKQQSNQVSSCQFPFNKEQVRILLFRECDWRGRRLLFDSSAIEPVQSLPNSAAPGVAPAATATTSSIQPLSQKQQPCTIGSIKKPLKPDRSTIEYYDGKPYKYGRPTQDVNHISEMVFGSVAISFRGTTFKVNWLQSPARALCSQVFLAPVQPYSSTSSSSTNTHSSSSAAHTHSSNYGSDMQSLSGSISESNSLNSFSVSESTHNVAFNRTTNPLDVPTALSLDNDDFKFISQSIGESSGYNSSELWTQQRNAYSSARSSLASIFSDVENQSRKMSISSSISEYPSCDFGHLNRRIMKNLSTSFENVSTITENMSNIVENNYYTVSGTVGLSDGCVSKLRRNSEIVDSRRKTTSGDALSSNSSTLHHSHNKALSKRPRLAVAVCINMSECVEQEMLIFCSEHMALLEQMIYRLRAAAENAYINRQNFLHLMIKAWHVTAQWLVDLFSAPRLTLPMWLSLSTGVKNSNVLVHSFMHDLCHLLNTADTKDTNFFVSTLLTAVLTHHLGWISTVRMITSNVAKDSFSKGGSTQINKLVNEENLKLSEISKMFPYNSLWAQLGDLYGAVTSPTKLSKTIICGNEAHAKTIEKLLNMLTYFIRCSEIRRNSHTKVFDRDELNKVVNQQLNQRKPLKEKKALNCNINKIDGGSMTLKPLRRVASGGLTRTSTTVKELNKVLQDQENSTTAGVDDFSDLDPETYRLLMKILKKNVMNDIPKVLAFRDSRFVRQELRIGNKSMDTGIEMSAKDRQYLSRYQKATVTGDHIKLTVTRPDNGGIEETIELDDDAELQNQLANFISLSDLITENSLGGAQMKVGRMFWEKNMFNEALNLEQIKHLERIQAKHQLQEESEKLKSIPEKVEETEQDGGVVFVLGDDEQLVGLKPSPSVQTIACEDYYEDNFGSCASTSTAANKTMSTKKKKACKHGNKHSGVKFNFEKYPQIATNYMRSKNLEFSELEVLEKGLRLERGLASCSNSLKPNFLSNMTLKSQYSSSDSDDECEFCKNGSETNGYLLQTPSNASELEFSSDQHHDSLDCATKSAHSHEALHQSNDEKRELKKCVKAMEEADVRVIEIPMLESIKKQSVQDEILKPGFTSSLFTSTSDHYISDMILQGITAPPTKWELQMKSDLSISSHCGVLEHSQAENVAIVANVEKWDVRLISSHSNTLPSHNTVAGIVGMSQLVANMLECVQAMFNSGISEYQCLSFIESKLREMYIHSETLATFLMDTEFCSLSTLTSTLGLSVNDIPLLMSIASIHSPQITKKYGISFR